MNKIQKNISEPDVQNWLEKYFTTGDTKYWGYIYEALKKVIFFKCLQLVNDQEDARDMTSDVFIKAFENLSKYEQSRPFYPWISQIARNNCIDHLRKKKRVQFEQIEEQLIKDESSDTTKLYENRETIQRINNAINQLKNKQKRCFCLFYIQQKSYQEIVKITGYTYNEVRSYIQNGKRNFKLILENN